VGRLAGRVAVITGGEGSVGLAVARTFVAEGARVVLAGIDAEGLTAAWRELGTDAAYCLVADVTNAGHVAQVVQSAVTRFGRLDIVVSNAGIPGVIAGGGVSGRRVRPGARRARARLLPRLQARGPLCRTVAA
jgi:NADP-dependent 3-hydroxy acid dehydrogenase YdfG